MRDLINKMRGVHKTTKKQDLSTSDLLNIVRTINEEKEEDITTKSDFEYEVEIAKKALDGFALRFTDDKGKPYFKRTNKKIVWGGVVNGIIRFIFIVEEDKNKSKIVFDYTDDFSPDNPENDDIIKKIESYYDSFYDRWIDEINIE